MLAEFGRARFGSRTKCPHHDPLRLGELAHPFAHEVAQPSFDLIALHGTADRLADDETDGRIRRFRGSHRMHDERRGRALAPATDHVAKRVTVAHAVGTREHVDQADRLARPLRRREDRIARPARVRMRRRKPCFLARRRLLGWKVRLLTSLSFDVCSGPRSTATARPRSLPRGHAAEVARVDLSTVRGAPESGQTGPLYCAADREFQSTRRCVHRFLQPGLWEQGTRR